MRGSVLARQGALLNLDRRVRRCDDAAVPPAPDDRRLTRQGKARKAELLSHAATLFAERGYAETRVIDIVRAAGVAKGLFYWYFENKEAVFLELVDDTRRRLRHEQAAAMDGLTDPVSLLYEGTRASVRFMARHHQLYALMQIEGRTGERFTPALRENARVHAGDIAVIIERGQRTGQFRTDDDATSLAYGVLGTVLYYVYFHRTGRLTCSVDELAETTARFVTRAVAADGDVPSPVGARHGDAMLVAGAY